MNLKLEDISNIIAFGNRCQMTGVEADTWVELKTRLVAEGDRMSAEQKAQLAEASQLASVGESGAAANGG